ncbi:MAG: carbon-nitrogen hydrolase family protein [Planctomycetota bacterium]|nr:carbon-nitrogen hydrolase family protein [Planctomycetota bacterium]MDA1142652.1 carbon-nitrogen hydrolase family protein [Planctomycetota bacterium]
MKDKTMRTMRLAAVTGNLDWSLRTTCSGDKFNLDRALAYIADYTNDALARMEEAARDADIVVGQEYFRGSEMFTTTQENRSALVESPDGPTSKRLGDISSKHKATLCCSYDADIAGHVNQTGIMTGPDGSLMAVHSKHPRRVPAPSDWPFNTGPRVYDVGAAKVGIAVCSDCTYDPSLPLRLASNGMEVMLLPGCGFAGDMWRAFLIVRARDTQCPVIYADDHRAAIADGTGKIVAETGKLKDIIMADVPLLPRRSSPDEPLA